MPESRISQADPDFAGGLPEGSEIVLLRSGKEILKTDVSWFDTYLDAEGCPEGCPELDVNCYGFDRNEAIRRLKNVLQFYIDSAQEFGLEVERFEAISIDGELNHGPVLAETLPASKSIN